MPNPEYLWLNQSRVPMPHQAPTPPDPAQPAPAIDFESEAPLACPLNRNNGDEICESCQ